MTISTPKAAILLRLRAIQHRVATAELIMAQAKFASLAQTRIKLETLKKAMGLASGNMSAIALKSQFEMTGRIDIASRQIEPPMQMAHALQSEMAHAQNKARRGEENAAELLTRTKIAGEHALALRADANLPFRQKRRLLERRS